jgi:hypothetical protein
MENATAIEHQQTGAFSNTDHVIDCEGVDEAIRLYVNARSNLLNINNWGNICGTGSATFQLTNENGVEIARTAKVGDHIKIDIPGPGPFAGKGYDWVKIENIDDTAEGSGNQERIIITVRPSPNPNTEDDTTAHFFSSLATSNFVVRRDGNKVSAAVLGRNEIPNTGEAEGADKLRNSMIAASAIAGIAKLQWTMLVKGLLK